MSLFSSEIFKTKVVAILRHHVAGAIQRLSAVIGIAIIPLVVTASAQSPSAHDLTLMSYNIFARDFIAHDGQYERLANLPIALSRTLGSALNQLDVIVFQELWLAEDSPQVVKFLSDMNNLGFKHVRKMDDGKRNTGMAFASRFAPVKQAVLTYEDASGVSEIAARLFRRRKGVFYILIEKAGRRYHIFATHLQADDSESQTREEQAKELASFIQKQDIPKAEPIIVAGDLNIDRVHKKHEFEKFLKITSSAPLELTGHKHCPSPTDYCTRDRNNPLVGADGDAKSYKCESSYDATGRCECCPQSLLDHVVYLPNRGKLVHGSISVIRPQTPKAFPVCMKAKWYRFLRPARPNYRHCRITWDIQDVSDHYAVLAKLRFQ